VLSDKRIAVVVPAFNEERWIEQTVRSMPSFVDQIVVVDDASSDRTSSWARRAGSARLTVLRHSDNRGVGAAIITGYRHASACADIIAVMAGDGQMHPDDLAAVLGPLLHGEADYVKGERLSHPHVLRLMPLHRLAGTAALAWLTAKAAGLPSLHDSQCGYTAITVDAISRIELDGLWPRYGYPNDLIGALARAGLRIAEVPVRPVYRGEASGLGARHLAVIGWLLARVAARRLSASGTRPSPRGAQVRPTAPRTPLAPPLARPRAEPAASPEAPA
jgi:glycosyltransferase involved in cell wall biosynthesis